jgi:hypothetical protein
MGINEILLAMCSGERSDDSGRQTGLSSFDDRAPSMRRIEQRLPENVIRKTSAKYRKAFQCLTGKKIEFRNVVVKSG